MRAFIYMSSFFLFFLVTILFEKVNVCNESVNSNIYDYIINYTRIMSLNKHGCIFFYFVNMLCENVL